MCSMTAPQCEQPMKIQLPAFDTEERAAPESGGVAPESGPPQIAKVSLPSKVLRWSSGDLSQDNPPSNAALLADDPLADLDLSPSVARSRSGSNLLSPPGLLAPPGTPSHGSSLHGTGNCRPCAWFWKANGCKNAQDCGHCHLCPEGEIKDRKKNKLTIMRLGLATPTSFGDALETMGPLNFGFNLMPLVEAVQPCSPWLYQDAALSGFAPHSEQESTNASGSEQGSLMSLGSRIERITASPSTERESAVHDSPFGSDREEQEGTPGPPPGLKAPPNTPSHGSVLHGLGDCRPCAWFWKQSGCQNGRDCNYCHVCCDGELKARKKNKQVAMRLGLATPKQDGASEQDARFALSLASCV